MTRKDFIKVAACIREVADRLPAEDRSARYALENVTAALARELTVDNDKFDKDRFEAAALGPRRF